MGRSVVVIYLALNTLVGPWLCCCSLATLASPSSASFGPADGRSSEKHSCCQDKGELSRSGDKRESDSSAPLQPHPCPCQKSHSEMTAVLPTSTLAEQASLQQGFHGWFLAAFSLSEAPAAGNRLIALFDGNALPFLTADDLLHSHAGGASGFPTSAIASNERQARSSRCAR